MYTLISSLIREPKAARLAAGLLLHMLLFVLIQINNVQPLGQVHGTQLYHQLRWAARLILDKAVHPYDSASVVACCSYRNLTCIGCCNTPCHMLTNTSCCMSLLLGSIW